MLIWDTGASFGLTPFRSDFIDYVQADIPVRDVSKVNKVIGIGTTLHLLMPMDIQFIFLVSLTTCLRPTFVCSLHKRITKCMVDTQKSMAIA